MTLDPRDPRSLLAALDDGDEGDRITRVAELLRGLAPALGDRHEAFLRYGAVRPRPDDGETLDVSPPGFCWTPLPGARTSRLTVWSRDGHPVYEHDGPDPVHQPPVVFLPGSYEWDVVGLDDSSREVARRGRWRFTITDDPVQLPRPDAAELIARVPDGHPRFLFPPSQVDAIRATAGTTRRRNWSACRRAADDALDLEPPAFPRHGDIDDPTVARLESHRYLLDLEARLDGAFLDLCLGYLITGDERYAEAAKPTLTSLAGWPASEGDLTSLDSRFGDGVAMSIGRCLHRGYDWLHPVLEDSERALVRSACIARARQIHRRLARRDFLSAPGDSHNGRLVVYLAEMAIVLAREAPAAVEWLDYALEALGTFYPHWGGRDGGWAEGPAYAMWYAHMALPGLEGLARATGHDLLVRPFFRSWAVFFIQCTAVRAEISPFGDGAEQVGPANDDERGYALLLWYFAHRYNDPHAGWWQGQVGDGEGFTGELSLLYEDTPPTADPSTLPASAAFTPTGWVALHGDIADPTRDAFLLLRSSPYGSVSHGHADQNGFALFKGGEALVVPSGYFDPIAGTRHHTGWTRTTRANNTILVDGQGQPVADPSAVGSVVAFESHPGWAYTTCDATDAYAGRLDRFVRHVLMVRPDVFVLVDELSAPRPVTWSWLLHSLEPMTTDPDAGTIRIRRGGATLDVHLAATAELGFEQTGAFAVVPGEGLPERYRPDVADQWHLQVENTAPTSRLQIAACMVTGNELDRPDITVFHDDRWFGVEAGGARVRVTLTAAGRGPEGSLRFRGRTVDGERFETRGAQR